MLEDACGRCARLIGHDRVAPFTTRTEKQSLLTAAVPAAFCLEHADCCCLHADASKRGAQTMTTTTRLLGLLAALALASAATLAQAAPQLQISPLSYQLTQLQPVPGNPRALDVTSRAGVVNVDDRALDVKAHLVSTSSNFIVLDGDVGFGDVPRTPQWKPTMSRDTFQLRVILPPHRDLRQLLQLLTSLHESLA